METNLLNIIIVPNTVWFELNIDNISNIDSLYRLISSKSKIGKLNSQLFNLFLTSYLNSIYDTLCKGSTY